MFHLGWFLPGWGIQNSVFNGWTPSLAGAWAGSHEREWMRPDLYVDLATALERGGFDFLLLEDTQQLDSTFRGSAEATLRMGLFSPKNDPMPLVPLLAARTRHLGLVPTVSSTFYPPYLAARLLSTLDHITEGRVGYNVVTSYSDGAAHNYGLDTLPPKNIRYEMAEEWIQIVKGLQSSWEPDAIIGDVERQIFADHTKVHSIDFVGKYFKCRGPLNTMPGPQGMMPLVEAGNSPAGLDLAARHASTLLAGGGTPEQMKSLRDSMHERLKRFDRKPSDCKIMFLVSPIVAETDDEARSEAERITELQKTPEAIENMLWFIDQSSGHDFSGYSLETPMEEILAELQKGSAVGTMESIFKGQEGKTLREAVSQRTFRFDAGLVGSPDTVASKMAEIMQETGGDGFLIMNRANRESIARIVDGLCPVLRRRGLIRDGYTGATFKENLLAF